MKAKKLSLLLLLCLVSSSLALSPEGESAYGELVTQLNDEIEHLNVDPDGNQNEILSAKQYLRQLENALAQKKNNRNIVQFLDNFGNFTPSAKVQKSLDLFKEALERENAAITRAYIAELEGILTKAADALQTADKPEDLDKTLDALNRNQFRNNGDEDFDGNDPSIRRLVSELSSARQFVAAWQDYIQASNAGNIQQSLQSLRNLSQQETTLIPRSQILARISFEQGTDDDITKVLDDILNLEDMRKGIDKMSKQTGSSRGFEYGSAQQEIFATLKRIDITYRDFLAGLPVRPDIFQKSSDPGEATGMPAIVKLRADLLRLTLPRMLELPEDTLIKENEDIDPFLTRATHEAVRRDDIAAAIRIRDMRQYILRSSSSGDKDSQTLSEYSSARQQIEAKQWMLAVVSLQNALKSGCDFIPAAKIGELLETILKEHPEEYKQGMHEVLSSGSTSD